MSSAHRNFNIQTIYVLNCSCSRDCIIIVNIADNHKSNMNDKSRIVVAVETASLSLILQTITIQYE